MYRLNNAEFKRLHECSLYLFMNTYCTIIAAKEIYLQKFMFVHLKVVSVVKNFSYLNLLYDIHYLNIIVDLNRN